MPTPSSILDLARWKLTLPVDRNGDGKPDEISSSTLKAGYVSAPWFCVSDDGAGVRFRAPVNGATTSGSANPRCELRELNADGSLASWSSTSRAHTLTVSTACTRLPNPRTDGGQAAVVLAQIHDSSNDICVFRLEAGKLWVTNGNTTHHSLALDSYTLGSRLELKFVVYQGKVSAYCNGRLVVVISRSFTGAYFKAGAYTQANCGNSSPCSSDNYGEAVVYSVRVEHADAPAPVSVPAPAPEPVPTPAPAPEPLPDATVLLIRHGEKPPPTGAPYGINLAGRQDSHSLTTTGWARAGALVGRLVGRELPRPDAIWASMGNTASRRPYQTIYFLARHLNLPIVSKYDAETQLKPMVAEVAARGGTTLVCLEHSMLPTFAKTLTGLDSVPAEWPADRFDLIWLCTRTAGVWTLRQVPQMCMPGDRNTVV